MGEPAARDVLAEALNADPDFDDPNMNNPSAWDLASDQLVALEAAGFRVIRSDPELAARLRSECPHDEFDFPHLGCVFSDAAELIDTDNWRTDG